MVAVQETFTVRLISLGSGVDSIDLTFLGSSIQLRELLKELSTGGWFWRRGKYFEVLRKTTSGFPVRYHSVVGHMDTPILDGDMIAIHSNNAAHVTTSERFRTTVDLPHDGRLLLKARAILYGKSTTVKKLLAYLGVSARNKHVFIHQKKAKPTTVVTDNMTVVVQNPRQPLDPDGILWPEGNGQLLSGKKPKKRS